MRRLLLLSITLISFMANAQTRQSIGLAFKAGTIHSKVSGINGYKTDLQRVYGINMLSPGIYFEHSFKGWSIQLGGWYMSQKAGFKDETVVNYGMADVFGETVRFNSKMRFVELDLGIRKTFTQNSKAMPFIGIYTTGSYIDTTPVTFSTSGQGSWGNANGNYHIATTYPTSFNLGLRPEIGFTLVSGRGREVSFSYTYHFGFNNIVEGVYTASTRNNQVLSQNKFLSSGNYTGIAMRYNITVRKGSPERKQEQLLAKQNKRAQNEANKLAKEREKEREKAEKLAQANTQTEPIKVKNGKPVEHKGRAIKVQKEITVTSPTLDLYIWDSGAKEDGDSISVYLNEELILSNHGLTKQKDKITVTLKPNQPNYVIIFAHNEGTEPPNTASISYILPSGGENIFNIYSKINQSGAIIIKYKQQ